MYSPFYLSTPSGLGWEVVEVDGGAHVVPVKDLQEHKLRASCPCIPQVETTGMNGLVLVVHNAFDHREVLEHEDFASLPKGSCRPGYTH